MVAAQALAEDLDALLDAHAEWLIVSGNGRTFPVNRDEIEIDSGEKEFSGCDHENGFRVRGLSALQAKETR